MTRRAWILATALLSGCGTPSSPDSGATGLTPVGASSEWTASSPAAEGLNASTLTTMVDAARRGEFGPISSVLVARHDRLVVEEYFLGMTADRLHVTQSVTKSVTSLLAGIAVDRGRLSVDATVTGFFPSYQPIAALDARKQAMTVRDLLTMRTGLDWSEASYASSPLAQLNGCGCDWLRFVLDWPMRESPGTRFQYVSGGVIVLGGVVQAATGERLEDLAASALFGPLGITRTYWYLGQPDGLPHTGGGLNLRPRDMLKIGQLVLNRGRWRGATVLSERWIAESTAVVQTNVSSFSGYPADYGYLWWRLPGGVITASGAQGQWIFIAPDRDLVMIVTGETDADFFAGPTMFMNYVLAAAGS